MNAKMNAGNDILIVGGSGLVGRTTAGDLAQDYPNRVIIAARDVEKASQIAGELGHGVRARRMDVRDRASIEAALPGVGSVISCVAQRGTPHLLLAAVAHGCGYTDIAPMWAHTYRPSEALKAEAVTTGARVILGAGIVAGISNIFARMGADRVGPVDSVASTCLLSAGDEYGINGREYLQEEFITAFKATLNGEKVLVWPFTRPQRVEFAPPLGALTAYLIPFSDQLYYPETLGARTAVSQLAFLPQWPIPPLSTVLSLARRSFLRRPSGMKGGLNRILGWLKRRYKSLDWWGAHVEVRGARGVYRASIQGHVQARGTALSASAFMRALIKGEVEQPGIWAAEQVVPVAPFLKRLAAQGWVPTVNVIDTVQRQNLHQSRRAPEGGNDGIRV
jgi:saccharopine dehydrogenase-like NADP-dependent oxidoreductase